MVPGFSSDADQVSFQSELLVVDSFLDGQEMTVMAWRWLDTFGRSACDERGEARRAATMKEWSDDDGQG